MPRGRKKSEIQKYTKSVRLTQEMLDRVKTSNTSLSVLVELGLKNLELVDQIVSLKVQLKDKDFLLEQFKDQLYGGSQ